MSKEPDQNEEQAGKGMKFSRWVKVGLKVGLTFLALFLVYRKIDQAALLELVNSIRWYWLVPAIVLFVGSKVATAIRLNGYFRNIGVALSSWVNWKLYLVGMFYNLFLPGGIGGDGYKVIVLHRVYGTSRKKLIQAALLDRLGGLVAIGFLMIGLSLFVPIAGLIVDERLQYLGTTLILFLIFPLFWGVYRYFFRDFIPSFWAALGWSFFGQILQLFSAWFILLSLGISETILAYQLVFLVSSVVAVLPLTIGGVGARELVFVYAHTYVGISESAAVAFSLLFFLITAGVSLMGAFVQVKKLEISQ